jgi:outer membrane protein TolC
MVRFLPALVLLAAVVPAGCATLRWDSDSAGEHTGVDVPHVDRAMHPAAAREDVSISSTAQPVDALVRQALGANPTVRAARFNVKAVWQRIPQVTALDDPILSNTIYPIPSVAPQYSLMGYMPYGALLAQQFPWCGTLRLRGQAAEADVKVALQELAAAELDVVAGVKRAYHDLHYSERAMELLRQNRTLAEDFLKIARERYRTTTATQVDVLRAEVAISDIDRELETAGQGLSEAQAELARLLGTDSPAALHTAPAAALDAVPRELERLMQLAIVSRPDLKGRLAAIARDQKAIELAAKRYYPNLTLGVVYQDMEKTNALTPKTAGGMPNVGLFVGMNLPVYRQKLAAGVCEAQARAAADAELYRAERDQARRDIKDLFVQARTQERTLILLRRTNLPAARQVLELTAADYRAGNAGVDYLALISAWRELLQVELQIAQVESDLGKAMASLERAVGVQWNEHPPGSEPVESSGAAGLPTAHPTAPSATGPPQTNSPFRTEARP